MNSILKLMWLICLGGAISGCRPDESSTPAEPPATVPETVTPASGATDDKSLPATLPSLPDFQEVASEMGINAPYFSDRVPGRYYLPEIMGGGATWFDFDRDGQLDLYLTNGTRVEPNSEPLPRGNWLYRGRIGKPFVLVDESRGAGDRGYGQGSDAGDFNSDGFPDLYVANVGPNSLYINEGDGTFSFDITARELNDPAWSSSVLWIDLNRDGWLDLYVTNYLLMSLADRKVCEYEKRPGYCGPGKYSPSPDHAFLNQGDGTFRDATEELGLTDTIGKGLGVQAADFDQDRIPEIYVANDMTANFMYKLQAKNPARYHDTAVIGGSAQSGEGMNEASMGIACADFDGDGLSDIYLTHYYNMQKTLYRNHGDLQFEDVSRRMRTAQTGFPFLGFGTVPVDYDADGFPDLFVTNGHVLGPAVKPDRMTPQWLHNHQGKYFEDVTPSLSGYFRKEWLGRGAATADYDQDGDLDIVVTHLDDPAALLRNSTVTNKGFIGFELSTPDRIVPCGTRVTVETSTGKSTKAVMTGGSYLSSSDPRVVFPVGQDTDHVKVVIEWSSGRDDHIETLATNRYWRIREGGVPW